MISRALHNTFGSHVCLPVQWSMATFHLQFLAILTCSFYHKIPKWDCSLNFYNKMSGFFFVWELFSSKINWKVPVKKCTKWTLQENKIAPYKFDDVAPNPTNPTTIQQTSTGQLKQILNSYSKSSAETRYLIVQSLVCRSGAPTSRSAEYMNLPRAQMNR